MLSYVGKDKYNPKLRTKNNTNISNNIYTPVELQYINMVSPYSFAINLTPSFIRSK